MLIRKKKKLLRRNEEFIQLNFLNDIKVTQVGVEISANSISFKNKRRRNLGGKIKTFSFSFI